MNIFNAKNIEFNKDIWNESIDQRKYMVSSVISNRIINGLSMEEVVDLLGFEFNDKHSKKWSYYIGRKTFFSIKCNLYIYFDAFGKVFKVKMK